MTINIEQFMLGYTECALWSTSDTRDESGDNWYNLDDEFSTFSDVCLAAMRADCENFIRDNLADLEAFKQETGCDDYRLGFLFWLNRERHGSGFWDEGADSGDRLSESCRPYGGFPLYGDFDNGVVRSHHFG